MEPFRLVFAYTRKSTKALVITTISMLLLVGVQLLVPWIIKTLIAALTGPQLSSTTLYLIIQLALIALAIYLARAVLTFIRSYLAHVAGWGWSLMCVNISMSTCSVFLAFL